MTATTPTTPPVPPIAAVATPAAAADGFIEGVNKRVPVCACNMERPTCTTCNQGYVEILATGRGPQFKVVPLDHQRYLTNNNIFYSFRLFKFVFIW